MWTKISHVLKPKQAQEEVPSGSVAGVSDLPNHSPPSSPSKRRGLFKRHKDDGSLRANPSQKLAGLPKKVKSTFSLHGNSSQLTVTAEPQPGPSRDISRRSSYDMLRPPSRQASRRSSFNILIRRPSVEALRSPPDTLRSKTRPDGLPHSPDRPKSRSRAATVDATSGSVRSILRDKNTPNSGLEEPARTRSRAATFDTKSGSVRSILLDHPTPGTGKSVRFYGPYTPAPADPDESFLERLQRSESMSSSISSAMPRFAPPSKSRRSVVEIFPKDSPASNTSESAPDFFGTLDVPPIAPLGLGFGSDAAKADAHLDEFTSTPYKDKDQEREDNLPKEHGRVLRRKDRSQRLPPSAMHDRSHSFSFGQTVFHSLDQSGSKRSSTSTKSSIISDDSGISAASSPSTNGRNRAQSDTGFMSMLRNPHPNTPESALAGGRAGKKNSTASEPDPFSADARTYYTPQTMIPTTPEGPSRHVRQASKEESIIFSLQAQLDMQNELCGQFETDLRAREELVEVLSKKLLEVEQEDAQKRKILRMWKKKVVELERTCRSLEDEVEGSRQESMDRSLMDEASSEALRMLHRQIAALERERKGLQRTEHDLREEVKRLEALVNDKTNEVTDLQQSSADENAQEERSEREAELEQRNEEEKTRHEAVETAWKEEKEDLLAAAETHKLENVELIALLEELKHQLRARDDEIGTLKTELGASGERANEAAKRLEAAETKDRAVESDHESHKIQVLGLQEKVAATEEAWTESERKVSELEDSVQELWDVKEALEVERERLKGQVLEAEGQVNSLFQELKVNKDLVVELQQERQYALDNISRLEDNIKRRDVEAGEYSQRILQREADVEALREQLSQMKREHSGESSALETAQAKIDVQAKQLEDIAGRQNDKLEEMDSRIRALQQESADKEVQIAQLVKQHGQDKDDLAQLNIALDSKQQELELLKRRQGVRGTAGTTTAAAAKMGHQRRDSSVLAQTPRVRPASLASSDSGTDPSRERKPSAENHTKISALGQSTRLNTSATAVATSSKPVRTVVGSMGPPPPPLRPRASIVGTAPTPAQRTLTRSSSARVISAAPQSQVKTKVTVSKPAASGSRPAEQQDEKENGTEITKTRRLSKIPTLAQ